MSYQVLNEFIEKEHKGTLYSKGETYPKSGFKADPERVAYLQSEENPYKVAFLGPEIKAEDSETEQEETSKEPSKPRGKSKNRSEE